MTPIFALLSIISKDPFYSILFFSLFGLTISVICFLNKLVYLGIFQIGLTFGTSLISMLIEMGE